MKAKGSGDRPIPGVTYRHPTTLNEWTVPTHLRRVKLWLQELVNTSGKKYEDFAVRK